MGNRSTEYDLVLSYLSYDWVSLETLIDDLMMKVQPGRAVREYQAAYRVQVAKRTNSDSAKSHFRELSQDEQIRSGRRTLLRKAIHSGVEGNRIAQQSVGNVVYLRRNAFSAQDVDDILSAKVSDVILPQSTPLPPPVPETRAMRWQPLRFDTHSIQHIVVKLDEAGLRVEMLIPCDDDYITCELTAVGADWLSDQLGFQAVAARHGKENSRKAIPIARRL